MAQISKIDHIEYGGVVYEFVDSTARDSVTKYAQKVYDNNERLTEMVNDEKSRAQAAEQALEDSKISRVAGKGLSTNDFTDEFKTMIENPPLMIGATDELNGESGDVPRPMIADKDKFLKGDGTWSMPATYTVATYEKDGLLSASDKYKLDTVDIEKDELVSGRTTFDNGRITEVLANGKTITTTFNADGSITQRITKANVDPITMTTVFNADGSITRTRS